MSESTHRISAAAVITVILGGVGPALGEYAPFTGGLASLAKPFGPGRNETALGYAAVGAIASVVIGLVVKSDKEE